MVVTRGLYVRGGNGRGEVRRAETFGHGEVFGAQRTWSVGVGPPPEVTSPSCVRIRNSSRSQRVDWTRDFHNTSVPRGWGKPGGRRGGRGFVQRPGGARGPEGRGSPPPARGGKRKHLSGRPQNFCPGVARQQPFSPVAGTRVTMATAPRHALRVFKEQARATAGCRKAAFRATAVSPPGTPPHTVPSPLVQAPRPWHPGWTQLPGATPVLGLVRLQAVRSGIPGPGRAGGTGRGAVLFLPPPILHSSRPPAPPAPRPPPRPERASSSPPLDRDDLR